MMLSVIDWWQPCFFVPIPDMCIICANYMLGADTILCNDGIKQASFPKLVIVSTKSMILKQENPWGFLVLHAEQLIIGGYAICKEEGNSKPPGAKGFVLIRVAFHNLCEAVWLLV